MPPFARPQLRHCIQTLILYAIGRKNFHFKIWVSNIGTTQYFSDHNLYRNKCVTLNWMQIIHRHFGHLANVFFKNPILNPIKQTIWNMKDFANVIKQILDYNSYYTTYRSSFNKCLKMKILYYINKLYNIKYYYKLLFLKELSTGLTFILRHMNKYKYTIIQAIHQLSILHIKWILIFIRIYLRPIWILLTIRFSLYKTKNVLY